MLYLLVTIGKFLFCLIARFYELSPWCKKENPFISFGMLHFDLIALLNVCTKRISVSQCQQGRSQLVAHFFNGFMDTYFPVATHGHIS